LKTEHYSESVEKIIEKFADVKVLVIGDVMLDRYLWGDVSRISPEAPVPIVNVKKTSAVPGGAANVAANINGLGAKSLLVGICGDDKNADEFENLLDESRIAKKIFRLENRQTTVKTRLVAHNQHVVRIDRETNDSIDEIQARKIFESISDFIEEADIVIISDYAKGFLTDNLLSSLIMTCQKKSKIVLVDPKGKSFARYEGATVLTPNKKESAEAGGFDENEPDLICKTGAKIFEQTKVEALLITQGEKGMTLLQKSGENFYLEALTRKVFDVTGAGDTVIAVFAVAVGAGASFFEAAKLANTAAGLVVREVGTTAISLEKLKEHFNKEALNQ
jgi:rfaE bifunctional protein kinase chain/domain